MAQDVYSTVMAHFEKRLKRSMVCPACGKSEWSVEAPVSTMTFDDEKPNILVTKGRAPLVPVVCLNCYHVMHFAWELIKKEVEGGGG